MSPSPAGKPAAWGRVGEGEAERRVTIVFRAAAAGERPLGCMGWQRIGASVCPPPPACPGAGGAHTQLGPPAKPHSIYVSATACAPWTKPHCEAPAAWGPSPSPRTVMALTLPVATMGLLTGPHLGLRHRPPLPPGWSLRQGRGWWSAWMGAAPPPLQAAQLIPSLLLWGPRAGRAESSRLARLAS